jgi:Uncharacterized conserved protein
MYSPASFFETVDKQGWMVVTAGVTVFYIIRPFVFWPLSLASTFLGYLVGFPNGVPLVLIGTVGTCLPPFLLANYFADVNRHVSHISGVSESVVTATGEIRGVVAARLSPAPADSVSIGAGLAGVSSWNFVIGTVIGELPWVILYVIVGQSLQSFSLDEIQSVRIELLLLLSAVAVLIVIKSLYEVVTK